MKRHVNANNGMKGKRVVGDALQQTRAMCYNSMCCWKHVASCQRHAYKKPVKALDALMEMGC